MPEYLSPGVYIEEVPSGPVPIQGVSTSTTGFVGCTERGPMRPTLVTSWLEYQRRFGGLPASGDIEKLGYMAHAVQGFFANGGQRAFIARVTDETTAKHTATLEIKDGGSANSKMKLVINAIGPGNAGANVLVKVTQGSLQTANSPATKDLFKISVIYYKGKTDAPSTGLATDDMDPDNPENVTKAGFIEPTMRETFDNLSLDPAAPNYVMTVVNPASNLIQVSKTGELPMGAIAATAKKYQQLKITAAAGASLEPKLPAATQYTDEKNTSTDSGDWKGLLGLSAIRDISILAIPDQGMKPLTSALLTKMQAFCENGKSCFAIAQFTQDRTPSPDLRPPIDSSYVAMYYPWLTIQNPETMELISVPPSGHMAGVYARTDIDRGVHKAPANEIVLGPILQNVGDTGPLSPNVTRGQQDLLNPMNVNCIRDFRAEGRGVRVWGGRTTSSNGQWRYVNVRRLFIFVEQSIDVGTQWVVFEPNDEYTWERVISSVSGFLNTTWRNGALMGTTPQEAYFVRCDRTTMTQDDIDNGRLVCLVGIAPVKPAEFVIFRFSQKTALAES